MTVLLQVFVLMCCIGLSMEYCYLAIQAFVLVCCVGLSMEYCYMAIQEDDKCTASNGALFHIGEEITINDNCEKCTCSTDRMTGAVQMGCCGYGIHGGVIAPPPGCKVIADTDGCTVKLVKIHNEFLDC